MTVGALAAPNIFARRPAASVVLYSSVDDYLLKDIIKAFETDSGITVRFVGDTEATKTTGLVQRLIAERARPRADVWWSSEPFGTIRLAEEGLLDPHTTRAEADFEGGWPGWLRAADKTWYGFALRARVMARNAVRIKPDQTPGHLRDLADPAWKGRIGMARPQFGTTRGHMAALLDRCGEGPFTDWLKGLRANEVRQYDGNAAVVRALRLAEIEIGLTDSDDVMSAEKQGWAVAPVSEHPDRKPPPPGALCNLGNMPIPNTAALVKGAPNPESARALLDFILSEKVERMLVASPSRNTPIRVHLRRQYFESWIAGDVELDYVRIAASVEPAMRICRDVLG